MKQALLVLLGVLLYAAGVLLPCRSEEDWKGRDFSQ